MLEAPLTDLEREIEAGLQSRINVARLIGEYRMRCGLSQEELGRLAGTKQSRVSEIENLRGNVRFDTLDRLASRLGLVVTLQPRNGQRFDVASDERTTVVRDGNQIDIFPSGIAVDSFDCEYA